MGRLESCGIPWETILDELEEDKLRGEFSGGSGRPMEYRFGIEGTKAELNINDLEDPTLHLTANADSIGGVLTLNLNTKGYKDDPELRHPDMYAGEFVGNALRILKRRGIVPCTFQGVWSNISGYRDNYHQFHRAYDKTKDNRAEAARETWSGRTLGRFFPHIRNANVSIEPAQILATFRR